MKKIIIIITVIAIVFAVSISRPFDIDPSYAISILSEPFSIALLILAILLQFCGHYLRARKQKLLLQQIRPLKTFEVFKGQMIGSLFNTILPLRLGELAKAHYIGKGVSISRSAVFATILFERLLDILFLLLLGVVVLAIGSSSALALEGILAILVLGFFLLAFILFSIRSQKSWVLRLVFELSQLFNVSIRDRIRMVVWSAMYGLKNAVTREILPKYLLLTITMWGFYILSVGVLAGLLFGTVISGNTVRVSIASYYGVSLPSGPAYLGSFQAIFTSVSNIPAALLHANNVTLVLWLLLVLPASIVGLYYLLRPQNIYNAKSENSVDTVLKNKLYRDADITKEFSHFLDAYFDGSRLNRILTSEELAGKFQTIKTFKGGSNALTLLAWQDGKMVVKKITLKEYRDKLKAQHDWLYERNRHSRIASIVGENDKHDDYYSIDIEFKDTYIPFFDFIHSSSSKTNKQVLNEVCSFVSKTIHTPTIKKKNGRSLLDKYLNEKVIGKITDSANVNTTISKLMSYEILIVNGRTVKNFNAVIQQITDNKQAMKDLANISESPLHGDLTVDNIIVDPKTKKFILLDPNNENAISDPVVDYGKLMQSVHSGYEFLVSLSNCRVEDNSISFEENKSVRYEALYTELTDILKTKLTPEKYRAVLFHEAVHYCRMLTYRCDINPKTAAVFYSIAVRLFNDFLEQYEDVEKSE